MYCDNDQDLLVIKVPESNLVFSYHNKRVLAYCEIASNEVVFSWNMALIKACFEGHYMQVSLMIDKGATYVTRGLYAACAGRHHRIILLLLAKGADIEKCTLQLRFSDIMWLVQSGVTIFKHYKLVAQLCRDRIVSRKDVLSAYLIRDLSNIIVQY